MEVVMHTDVNAPVGVQTVFSLMQGQEVHLGRVPKTVLPRHNIFVSCPEITMTYVVQVDRVYDHGDGSRHAYATRGVEHHLYVPPAA